MTLEEQAARIRAACDRDRLRLVGIIEEPDVSGGTPLAKRKGLRRAVEMIEAGAAQVLVVAYFDRLVRSLRVQLEVTERIEQAGGSVIALDVGELGNGAAATLTSSFLGAVAQYHRDSTRERTEESKERAVARGVPPFSRIPPGLRRRDDGTLEPDPQTAPVVVEAFRMRAEGASITEVREFLRRHGIARSIRGVSEFMRNPIYRGTLVFGSYRNPEACEPLIDAETFAKVRRLRLPRGRKPVEMRLLNQLGVLRCASCGGPLAKAVTSKGHFVHYACRNVDCEQRVAIGAKIVEEAVWDATVDLLRDVEGSATGEDRTGAARLAYERAEEALQRAVETLEGFEDVAATRTKLETLREARDAARADLEAAEAASGPALRVRADDERLTLEERRALVLAVVAEARVSPGRGADRIEITAR
jgi:DNA invertase Pin-like site-specific DNA recombinase